MLCKPHKHAGNGQAARKVRTDLRQLGKVRRVRRHELGDAASWNESAPSPGDRQGG